MFALHLLPTSDDRATQAPLATQAAIDGAEAGALAGGATLALVLMFLVTVLAMTGNVARLLSRALDLLARTITGLTQVVVLIGVVAGLIFFGIGMDAGALGG